MALLRRALTIAAGMLLAAGLLLAAALGAVVWVPADVEPGEVHCEPDAPAFPRGETVKVLVWNIQYAGSRDHHFFYDGGPTVGVSPDTVRSTLDALARTIRAEDPDLVLLQEVDRDSRRTGNIDQLEELLRRVPFPCHASTPYHRAGYVPVPSHEHLGKVDMHLAVLSRFRILAATRHQLALLDEPWWRQLFNLRRALLDTRVALDDGSELRVFNTHLSAFSGGDGTLTKQMTQLGEHMARAEQQGEPWVLGGDLNSLPPSDDPARLGPAGVPYATEISPVTALFRRFNSLIPEQRYDREPESWRTYLPPGATEPDRTLDYVFYGRKVAATRPQMPDDRTSSDHMPIVFELLVE